MPSNERIQIFASGIGIIEPTHAYSDSEVLQSSDEAQKPIQDRHVVCFDERRSVNEKQPIREKVAGGNLTTSLMAAAAVDWDEFTEQSLLEGPEAMAEIVADYLVEQDEPLGAHRHSPRLVQYKTGCSAVDESSPITIHITDEGMNDSIIDQARIDLGDSFNEDHWVKAHTGYSRMSLAPKWQHWRTSRVQEIVEEHGGVVEVLDAENDALKQDPDNLRKNHWAEFLRVNQKPGMSNDRDNATIPGFQLDVSALKRIAEKMAKGNQRKYSELLHAMVMYQYGTGYLLTKNMRIIR